MARRKKGRTHDPSQFIYVDVCYEDKEKSKRSKWLRKKIDEVDAFQQKFGNYNVFATVQRFMNPARVDSELMYMPLYFDLDSNRNLLQLLDIGFLSLDDIKPHLNAEDYAAVSNYVTLRVGFDNVADKTSEDAKYLAKLEAQLPPEILWYANLKVSQSDARKLRDFFKEELDVMGEDFRVYFSGKKGFHCLVSAEALGVEARSDLHQAFKFIALFLKEKLDLQALDYGSIYSSRRMLRLPNSIHQSTKLFKTELYPEELDLDVEEIIALAKSPRGEIYKEANPESDLAIEKAHQWYFYMVAKFEDSIKAYNEPIIHDEILKKMDDYPVCVQDILTNGIKKAGDRNKATMALASYFKDIGMPIQQSTEILIDWLSVIKPEYTSTHGKEAEASTRTAIKTVYENDKYHFGCPFILSLHGERKKGSNEYDAVACAGRKCPLHQDHRKDMEEAIEVHLSDSGNAEYAKKKISTKVLVSGKLDIPYLVPKKVKYICYNEDCQKECVLRDHGFVMEKEFAASDRILIEATHQADNNLKGTIKAYGGAACPKHTFEVLEYENVEELLVVPMAERVSSIKTEGDEVISAGTMTDEHGKEFVSRKIYYVGKDRVLANNYYTFDGYVYPHPKNQTATILSQVSRPLQDSIDTFRVTEESKELTKIFQIQPGETINQRIDFILQDLTDNVTRIWERYEALLALLWTYHSAINFYFQDELVQRGWLETILVGDTGQAKTKMTSRLMDFIGLGDLIGGETASRTGLIYKMEQIGDRWFITFGKYPLNDRRLLVIDEFSGLSDEDFAQMTEARSTGILRITRARTVETNARVRLVLMSNPKWGKQLHEFQYGVESLKYLFKEASDIRRLDLAVFMATKDVDQSLINREYEKPAHQYISAEALKSNVLWAWSRKPEHIKIPKKVEKLILKRASELSDKYGSAKDIPIVIPEEERIKLARLAVANAMLRHSTDETGELVLVEEQDVNFVCEMLQHIFDAKNCRYDVYARNAKEESELTPEEKEKLTADLQQLDFDDNAPISREILELFRRNDTMKPTELRDMTGYEAGTVNARIAVLAKYGMIKKTKNGLRVLPKFLEYLDQTKTDKIV